MRQKNSFPKIWNIAKLLLAILLIFIVVSKTNFDQIQSLKEDIVLGWFAVNILSFIVMTLVKADQYHLLLGGVTRYRDVLRVVIWQNTISNFIATSAGIASYMAMLKTEQNVKLARSGVAFLITKFGDLLAICFYLALSAVLVWSQIQPLHSITILLMVGILSGLMVVLVTVLWRERFVSLITSMLAKFKLNRFFLVSRGLDMLYSLAREEQETILVRLRTGVLMSFVYMTVTMISAFTGIRMFDIQLGVWPVIYVAALMQLVSFVPIQVLGGLGVMEVTSVYLYSFFGLDQGEMSAVMLGLRAIFYLMNASILLYLPISAFLEKNIKQPDKAG
jgi:uncharacterized membrane protein YbhN (UPF0104 family)